MRRERGTDADGVRDEARHAVRKAAPWIERLGRLGYASKGLVYVLLGSLAATAAIGTGGATTDIRGLLQLLVREPLGRFFLGAIALGFAGYALWRFVQAGFDTENAGADAKGLLVRATFAIIGMVYAMLAVSALRLFLGGDDDGVGSSPGWVSWLLAQPSGEWLIAAVGLAVLGFGARQLYRAYSASFLGKLKLDEIGAGHKVWVGRLGRLGYAARGVVFGIVGRFLITAAVQARAHHARGLSGALEMLGRQPFGPWLLGAVAAGLISYGVFTLVEARYRRMVIS